MEFIENAKQGTPTFSAAPPCTRSVAERRLLWLLRQHPHMSRDVCRRWAFRPEREQKNESAARRHWSQAHLWVTERHARPSEQTTEGHILQSAAPLVSWA